MKNSISISSLFLCLGLFACTISQKDSKQEFSIKINMEAALTPNLWKEFSITQDSILINTKEFNRSSSYADILSKESKQRLLDILSNNSFNKLDSSYINSNVDDGADFTFTISFRKQSKKITVHHTKVQELSILTQALDSILPIQYKTGYDEKYWGY